MRGQRILEPDHDIGVVLPRLWMAVGIRGRQAIDKRVKQFLLQRSRDFRIRDQCMSRLGETASPRMKPQQARCGTPRRSQHATDRWGGYFRSGQGLAAGRELLRRQRDKAPLAYSIGPLMRSLAAAVEHDVAEPQSNSAGFLG